MSKKLETILRWGVYFTALVPMIIFSEFHSPFHFGKVVVFRTFVEILAVIYILLISFDKKYLPRTSPIFWSVTAFMGVFGLTSLTGINVYQSVMGSLERMGGWFTFFHFWIFFIILSSVIRTKENWKTLLKISVYAALISIIYGLFQKGPLSEWFIGSGYRQRIFGTIGNTALFAGYVIVNIFFAIYLAVVEKNIGRYFYAFIAGAGVLSVILFTVVRGSILGLIASFFVFTTLVVLISKIRSLKIAMLAVAIVILVNFGLVFVNRDSNFVTKNAFFSRIVSTRTADTRIWAWQAGIDGWNDSAKTIVFGWGPENFNIPFSIHFNPNFFQGPGSETLFDRAHNMFVEVLVTMGVLGIASYLSIFIVLFWLLYKGVSTGDKDKRNLALIFIPGIVAYMIHNSFIFDTSANFVVFFTMLAFIDFSSADFEVKQKNTNKNDTVALMPATSAYSVLILVTAVACFSIYKTDIKPAKAIYASTRAVVAAYGKDYPSAIAKFREALSYDTFPIYELRHKYAQYVFENYGNFKPELGLNAGEIIFSGIEEAKKNTTAKLDYLPYLYISRGYIILGKSDPNSKYNDFALEASKKALEISPNFVRTYYEVAQAYINKKDYVNAVATFQKAADLNPDVGLSWWYLGLTKAEGGDPSGGLEDVKKAIDKGYQISSQSDFNRLSGVYTKAGDLKGLSEIYLRLIEMNPNNADYHAGLAATYAELGMIDEAVEQTRIAVKLDKTLEAEAKKFVENLGRTL